MNSVMIFILMKVTFPVVAPSPIGFLNKFVVVVKPTSAKKLNGYIQHISATSFCLAFAHGGDGTFDYDLDEEV